MATQSSTYVTVSVCLFTFFFSSSRLLFYIRFTQSLLHIYDGEEKKKKNKKKKHHLKYDTITHCQCV